MRTEDGRIIRECLNGDSASFGLLVDKYKASIYALAYSRLRNFHDAEDIAQDVFLKAYENLRTLRRWDSFLVWIRSIAINLCKNKMRTRSRRPDGESIEDQETRILEKASADIYRDEQLSISRDEALSSLDKAMESLPEVYQQVLTLHYLGGMSGEQMSRFLGISHANVRQRLSRARRQLREEVLAVMSSTYEGQRLQASFTFRIVEAVKRIKIHPMPRMAGLPWGLSFAVGIIITVLSLNPHMSITSDMAIPASSPLPVEAKVLKTGEIPVDVLKTSEISVIASKLGDDDGRKPQRDPHTLMLAPQAEGGTWTQKADMPTAKWGLSTSVLDGIVYAIGGSFGENEVAAYNPATDEWTKRTSMPTGRMELATGKVNGKIYAIGGAERPWPTPVAAVEEYDPAADRWTKRTDMPTPRGALSASVVDGIIYAIGGMDKNFKTFSTVEAYDPVTDTWEGKAPMPTPRSYLSTSIVDGIIYAIGGAVNPNTWDVTQVVEAYDPATDEWTAKADMPISRGANSTSVVDGIIYVVGGHSEEVGPNIGITRIDAYDPVTDTWTQKADMPTGRHTLSSSALDGKIYVIGGVTAQGGSSLAFSTVEEYTPEKQNLSSVSPQGKLPAKWGEMRK